ncbi:MAG: glycosyltransferase, partial [Steroidobacteraceae bacterium]
VGLPVLAYVVNSLNPGGAEKLVVEMSLAFAAQFRVHVFCLDEPGLWAGELRERGIPVHCLWRQPGLDLLLACRLARALRACGARIVHAHQCTAWFYSALSRLRNRTPRLLLEEHGRFFPEKDSLRRRVVNRLLIRRLTHSFVAVSEDIRRRLQRYEGLDERRIEVIYNGVAAAPPLSHAAREALRAEFGFRPDHFVVGTVGRLDPIKNLPMLVRSLAAASEQLPAIHGLLVGDGEQLAPTRALIASVGLADRVRLTGFRSDARRLIQSMDLFVLASFSEGTSMALLEALAAGVPVAVTAVGGNPEIVVEGETGWVVPSGAAGALSAAMLEAAGAPQLRRQRAEAGRRRFEERFAFATMISSYLRLYRSMLPAEG